MTETEENDLLMHWRRNLRQSLRARNVTLGEASEAAGKNPEYLGRVLSGKINPTMDTILTICIIHEIAFSELFSGVNEPDAGENSFLRDTDLSEESTRIARQIIRTPEK